MDVDVVEVSSRFAEMLDLVAAGEEIIIVRDGLPIARLGAAADAVDSTGAHEAAAANRQMSKGVRLDGLSIKDLIDDGRR